MDESRFWEIISATKPGRGGVERQAGRLEKLLSKLAVDDVVGFDVKFTELNLRLYTWDHWGAAEVIFGGCSDDHFTDFRSWIITRGRDVYEAFSADPDGIVELGVIDEEEVGSAEEFSYVASEVYEEKTGEEIDDALEDRDIIETSAEPAGEPLTPGDRDAYLARYPRLTAMFWSKPTR